jgi:hypothetical protein
MPEKQTQGQADAAAIRREFAAGLRAVAPWYSRAVRRGETLPRRARRSRSGRPR